MASSSFDVDWRSSSSSNLRNKHSEIQMLAIGSKYSEIQMLITGKQATTWKGRRKRRRQDATTWRHRRRRHMERQPSLELAPGEIAPGSRAAAPAGTMSALLLLITSPRRNPPDGRGIHASRRESRNCALGKGLISHLGVEQLALFS
ncbi:hypothetical protein PAHAL_9G247500 [Panicum hallii]|uniref:Uncharacterized protein n=1 Tax=Panicum hallii TaxID=206008 RepID=A0A2T8I2H0_9POAL|nr:hypothetical protein PAHAL_9G247500 [Panicum hallii]